MEKNKLKLLYLSLFTIGIFAGTILFLYETNASYSYPSKKSAKHILNAPLEAISLSFGNIEKNKDKKFISKTDDSTQQVVLIKNASALDAFYDQKKYDLDKVRKGNKVVPNLEVQEIPFGWTKIKDISKKKELFIKTMLPMVLSVNNKIIEERQLLKDIQKKRRAGGKLSTTERKWIDHLSDKYLVKSKSIDELLLRIDVIPTSLALAQSIEESGWGTSYFVRKGNALFGQVSWSSGMAPRNNPRGVKTRSFANLMESVKCYMHNLNTHSAYQKFREMRKNQRVKNQRLNSYSLAGTLIDYSERRHKYIKNIRSLIKTNRLTDFENTTLRSIGSVMLKPKKTYF